MVCDGVGGAARGEVASQLAVRQFDAYFRAHPVTVATADYVQQALTTVQDQFDVYVRANPSAVGMGTTLTLVYVHEAGLTVAHLGDSRVYLVRGGRIEWRTDDHSYVNELVKGGVLTADEARHHPQRNVITRAIQSGGNRPLVDVQVISDLQAGDYFFLCSDGVLERVSDELLENVLGSADSNEDKMQILLECCTDQTRDNFTAYLLQIDAVSGNSLPGFTTDLPAYERPVPATADEVMVVALSHPELDYVQPATSVETVPDRPSMVQAQSVPPPPAPAAKNPVYARIMGVLTLVLLLLGSYVGWKVLGKPRALKSGDTTTAALSIPPVRQPAVARPRPVSSLSVPNTSQKPVSATFVSDSAETEVVREPAQAIPQLASHRPAVEREVEAGLYVGVVDGKRGLLLDDRSTWLIAPQFDKIGQFHDGLANVRVDGEAKYLSLKGNIYDEISPAHCDRIRVRTNDKWGYLNLNGAVAIGIRYPKATSFHDGDCTADVYIGSQSFRIDRIGRDIKTGRGPVASIAGK